jgi:hypothetical protein
MPRFAFRLPQVLLSLLLVSQALAQAPLYVDRINMTSPPVPGSGHDYLRMLNDTVNPANGSLSVRIEAPVPKQRGDLNFPYFVFGYDSTGVSLPTSMVTCTSIGGFCQTSLRVQWDNSSNAPECGTGLLPGTFVANAGVGKICNQYVGLSTFIPGPNINATCDYFTGFVYIDPYGARHGLNLQWISKTGAHPAETRVVTGTEAPRRQLSPAAEMESIRERYRGTRARLNGPFPFQTYETDSHGRASLEDTNGNCCGPTVQTTVANGQITSATIPGLASPYSFTYGPATRNYTPGSTFISSGSSASGCPSTLPTENTSKTVVKTITLPNGQKYQLEYDQTFGLLNKIIYPTGAWISYTWAGNSSSESLGIDRRHSIANIGTDGRILHWCRAFGQRP